MTSSPRIPSSAMELADIVETVNASIGDGTPVTILIRSTEYAEVTFNVSKTEMVLVVKDAATKTTSWWITITQMDPQGDFYVKCATLDSECSVMTLSGSGPWQVTSNAL